MRTSIGAVTGRLSLIALLTLLALVGSLDPTMTPAAPVHAQAGALLKTINIPAQAQNCPGGTETSVVVIAGRMVGVTDKQILLGVSCLTNNTLSDTTPLRTIYFLDPGNTVPSTTPQSSTVLKTIVASGTLPSNFLGWGAITPRVDKGDIAACSNTSDNKHAVYKIAISPFGGPSPGTTTKLFDLPPSAPSCDGLAWDPGDNSFFQSFENATTIAHTKILDETKSPPTTTALQAITTPNIPAGFPGAGTPCQASGLATAGPSLYVACGSSTTMIQITTQVTQTFPTAGLVGANTIASGHQLQDADCDPSWPGLDVIWSKDKVNNQLFAFQVPNFTCGFRTGDPTKAPAPAQCPTGSVPAGASPSDDTDGDGLLDCWERAGIDYDGDGTADFVLPSAPGTLLGGPPDPLHKDVYVELDYMDPLNSDQMAALNDVIAAFAAAPAVITGSDGVPHPMNPDGTPGIRLHIQVDDQLPVASTILNLAFEPCTAPLSDPTSTVDFDALKAQYFGTLADRTAGLNRVNARRFAFRYAIIGRQLLGQGSTSGCSEVFGNDMVVTPWLWPNHGTRGMLNGTFMHELGHTLGRRHGGDDNVNCKPNYLSVMSYSRQVDGQPIPNRKLDYSRQVLPTLNEASPPGMNEPAGVGGPLDDQIAYGVPKKPSGANVFVIGAAQPWNLDSDTDLTDLALGPPANPNNLGSTDCNGDGTLLVGSDDWSNLLYGFQDSFEFGDGVAASLCLSPRDLPPYPPNDFVTCGHDRLTDKNDFTQIDAQQAAEVKKELTKEEADAIAANSAPHFSIAMTDSPDPVKTQRDLIYTITVQNLGPKPGTNVTVTDSLPPTTSARFVSATFANGTTSGNCPAPDTSNVLTCNLGSLAIGSSATVTVDVRPRTEGTLSNTAGVSSDPDVQLVQSQTTQTTTVTKSGP